MTTKHTMPKRRWQATAGLTIASMILSMLSPLVAEPVHPAWWGDRNVTNTNTIQNHAVVNLGQAKWMVTQAYAELDVIPGGLGFALTDLFPAAPASPDAAWYEAQKKPLNLGQLKALAKPFYDQLNSTIQPWLLSQMQANGLIPNTSYFQETTTGHYYPWNPTTPVAENYKPANLGQLKSVFNLRFRESNDGDSLPDAWEYAMLAAHPESGITDIANLTDTTIIDDGDTLTVLQEYQNGTDPFLTDTDGDGLSDDHQNGLEALWHLDETSGIIAADGSGNNHNADLVNGPTFQPTEGVSGGGLGIMATTAYLKLPHEVLNGANDVTVSMWYKSDEATGTHPLLSGAMASNTNRFLLGGSLATSPPRMEYWDDSAQFWDQDELWIDGTWHHHVFVRNVSTGEMKYYLDGTLLQTKTGTFVPLQIDAGGLLIGQEQDALGAGFDASQRLRGSIDEIRIYRRVLSDTEVTELQDYSRPTDLDNNGIPDDLENDLNSIQLTGDQRYLPTLMVSDTWEVTARDYLGQPIDAKAVSFTHISGTGSLPGGGNTLSRNTAPSGKVAINDFTPSQSGDDRVRVSIATALGNATAYLPADINGKSPSAPVDLSSLDYLQADIVNPNPPTDPDPDNQIVGSLRNYLGATWVSSHKEFYRGDELNSWPQPDFSGSTVEDSEGNSDTYSVNLYAYSDMWSNIIAYSDIALWLENYPDGMESWDLNYIAVGDAWPSDDPTYYFHESVGGIGNFDILANLKTEATISLNTANMPKDPAHEYFEEGRYAQAVFGAEFVGLTVKEHNERKISVPPALYDDNEDVTDEAWEDAKTFMVEYPFGFGVGAAWWADTLFGTDGHDVKLTFTWEKDDFEVQTSTEYDDVTEEWIWTTNTDGEAVIEDGSTQCLFRVASKPDAVGGDVSEFKLVTTYDSGSGSFIELETVTIELDPSTTTYNRGLSLSLNAEETSGPKYRKISLTGLPLSDSKPQAEAESDAESEETYIDALSLDLQHSTTDIYIPVPSSDLALSVRRNASSSTWTKYSGLKPHEKPDKPFGAGWNSNITSYVVFSEQTTSGGTLVSALNQAGRKDAGVGQSSPNTATVIDENGSAYSFVINYEANDVRKFYPTPTALTQLPSYMATLTEVNGVCVFKKKFGTTLTFGNGPQFDVANNRIEGSRQYTRSTYHRLVKVQDRAGNALIYDYTGDGDADNLIPTKIYVEGRPNLQIRIDQDVNGYIQRVQDSNGNIIEYDYLTQNMPAGANTSVGKNTVEVLEKVTRGSVVRSTYGYSTAIEPDRKNFAYTTTGEDLRSKTSDDVRYDEMTAHVNLSSIDGPYADDTISFEYVFDLSRNPYLRLPVYDVDGKFTGQCDEGNYALSGITRNVTKITLPGGRVTDMVGDHAITSNIDGEITSNARTTTVTDAEQNERIYQWGTFSTTTLPQALVDYLDPESYLTGRNQLFGMGSMSITFKDSIGVTLGSESFNFDASAGYAAKTVTDFSNNQTSYTYTEDVLGSAFDHKHSDPTTQTNALAGTKSFAYDASTRVMTEITDEMNRKTVYLLDEPARVSVAGAIGRRTTERRFDENSVLLAETRFYYQHATFASFMTKKQVMNLGSNAAGDPVWVTPLTTLYVADSYGRVARDIIDFDSSGTENAGDLVTAHTYDANGNKLSTTDAKGNTTGFVYDALNRLTEVHHADGTQKLMVYDLRGNKVMETDENGISSGYYYDNTNRLVKSIRDMNGNLSYNAADNTFSGENSGTDIISSVSYDNVNSPVTTTDPRGYISKTEYDGLQRPVKIITPNAITAKGAIPDPDSNPPTGYVTEMAYLTNRNTGGSAFNVTGFKPTSVTDARGFVTHITYDALYRPTDTWTQYEAGVEPKFTLSKNQYDALGNVTFSTAWRTPCDAAGTLYTSTLAVGEAESKVSAIIYDKLNRPLSVTKSHGSTFASTDSTEYTSTGFAFRTVQQIDATTTRDSYTDYDAAGRPIETRGPPVYDPVTDSQQRPVTITTYDANSNVISTQNPLGQIWNYLYDSRNRRTQEIQPAVLDAISGQSVRPVITTEYDLVGNVLAVTDARLFTSTMDYDDAYRVTLTTTPPVYLMGQGTAQPIESSQTYDNVGNILTATDGNGQVTVNTYDSLGRLATTKTNPVVTTSSAVHTEDILITNDYDASGNLITVTDALDHVTAFEYDGLNRKTHTHWDNDDPARKRTEQTDYDAMLATQQTNPNQAPSVTGALIYDARFRLSTVSYPSSTNDDQVITYDLADRKKTVIHTNAPDTSRDTGYTYDGLDRILTETSVDVIHTYEYDLAGNSRTTSYGNNGRSLASTYDDLNRLKTVTESGRTTEYKYDLAGNIVEKILPSGQTTQKDYNAVGRVVFIVNESPTTTVNSFEYEYDATGNVREVSETYPGGNLPDRTVINNYDKANRLALESIDNGSLTVGTYYVYDKANNRTTKSVTNGSGAGTTLYIYGNATNGLNSNQLVSYTKPDGDEVSFTYDDNGNRETKSVNAALTQTYAYDLNNRLLSVVDVALGSYAYQYDARTRRVVRDETSASGDHTLLSFSAGLSVQEYTNSASTPAVEHIRGSDYGGGIGGILYTLRGGTPAYNTYNSRGDVVSKTNDTGTITWEAAYEAFGTRTEEDGSTEDRQKANTKDEDPTGLLNEGMRYRDLEAGIFITRDPMGFVDGPNVYTYVTQNPWTFFDPDGLKSAKVNNGETRLIRYEYTGSEKDPAKIDPKDYKLTDVKEKDYAKVKGKMDIFINGIQNKPGDAARNAHDKMGTSSGYMIYNPAESFLKDTWQCAVGKNIGQSKASAETAYILSKLPINHGESTIHAHSQGTIIATNAIRILAKRSPEWRTHVKGIKAKFWGPAVNKYIASGILKRAGANFDHKTDWKANPADPVTQILGMNSFSDGRPWRFGMAVAASPYMTSTAHSPHSNKAGATKGWTSKFKLKMK